MAQLNLPRNHVPIQLHCTLNVLFRGHLFSPGMTMSICNSLVMRQKQTGSTTKRVSHFVLLKSRHCAFIFTITRVWKGQNPMSPKVASR